MTARQKEIIADNLRSFKNNFGEVRIEDADYDGGFYVFYPTESETWIQYCYNIDYLNGWLYGVVQGAVRGEFKNPKYGTEENNEEVHGNG